MSLILLMPSTPEVAQMIGVSPSVLGFNVSGDLGPLTIYTDRFGRKISYLKAPPRKPYTVLQQHYRQRFRNAMLAWSYLLPTERAAYERCSQVLQMCMMGHNIWVSLCVKPRPQLWQTLQQQSGVTLAPPVSV